MDGKKWYWCDPRKNAACRKRMCCIYGGTCELTSHAEYAANDPAGRPIEINPRERLREKMKRKKDRKNEQVHREG